jgi:hypothetical protein
MNSISIDELFARLNQQIAQTVRDQIDMEIVGESGLSMRVDGKDCLTSIGVWPNGCCDVDFLFVETEKGEFRHFEFQDTEAATGSVLQEIMAAVERAS